MSPEWYQANREDVLAKAKARYEKNRLDPEWVAKKNAYNRARDLANPEAKREAGRKYRAKVKADPVLRERDRLKNTNWQRREYRQQAGIIDATDEVRTGDCCLCLRPDMPLVCDHWHDGPKLGEIRGWICNHCNMAAGALGDNLAAAERLMAYMQ